MKKIAFMAIVIIVCIITAQNLEQKLDSCRNVLLMEFEGSVTHDSLKALYSYPEENQFIEGIGVYSNKPGRNNYSSLQSSGRSSGQVSVYQVDQYFPDFLHIAMRDGRFIWNRDIEDKKSYIVIEKDMAVQLFNTYKCSGRKLTLMGKEYTVIGVYDKSNSFIDSMSAVEENAVYIPLQPSEEKASEPQFPGFSGTENRYVLLVKTVDNTAMIIERTVREEMGKLIGKDLNSQNLDKSVRLAVQSIRIAYLLMALIGILYFGRWVVIKYRDFFRTLRDEYRSSYFKQLILSQKISLILCFFATVSIAAAVYFIYRIIRFEFLLDPAVIPARLVDTENVRNTLMGYYIGQNTKLSVISYQNSLVEQISNLFVWISVLLVLLFWKLAGYVNNRIKSRRNADVV